MSPALIIFVRTPVLGKVKTRLAASVGDHEALRIYRLLQNWTKEVATSCSCKKYLFYAGDIDQQDIWDQTTFVKKLQSGATLGDRMKSAFQQVLASHDKVVIIGSDCAQLREKHVEKAFENLESSDIVIGPAMDGGYYLLGMTKSHEELFSDIPWSTDQVANITITKAKKLGLTISHLETLSDIDTYEDWKKYGENFITRRDQ